MQHARILLVDDDPGCLESLKACFFAHDHLVDTASDPDEAFLMLQMSRSPYDILMTDFEMPGRDGVDLFLVCRTIHPEIEGILVSGALTDERRAIAMQSGMLAALHKGRDCDTLMSLVERVLMSEQTDA